MRSIFLILGLSVFFFFSCSSEKEESKPVTQQQIPGIRTVKVLESMDASNYTYIKVQENENEFWIAVPQIEVRKGETLFFSKSMEMKNFKSETLERTFESILFVDDIRKEAESTQIVQPHPIPTTAKEEQIKIAKASDGKSIGEIFGQLSKLNGKIIKVRGKVVKFNPDILGTNWIHIQDGTEYQNEYDLLITSDTVVRVGQIITAEGKLITNKDFGSGYSYKALIENANIKTEL